MVRVEFCLGIAKQRYRDSMIKCQIFSTLQIIHAMDNIQG